MSSVLIDTHDLLVQIWTYNTMPMQLADGTFLQMSEWISLGFNFQAICVSLLCSRNVVAGRQICDYLLSYPASVQQPSFGVGEGPLQTHNYTTVC